MWKTLSYSRYSGHMALRIFQFSFSGCRACVVDVSNGVVSNGESLLTSWGLL